MKSLTENVCSCVSLIVSWSAWRREISCPPEAQGCQTNHESTLATRLPFSTAVVANQEFSFIVLSPHPPFPPTLPYFPPSPPPDSSPPCLVPAIGRSGLMLQI
ncbi:hypothetical protein E2C01_014273 [Portunus trituberculatus]|uniref:Uncharacterized protein n=1 Tax=Portunus trituberculatus TaxID=210409 RepID=A0A5B7DIC9_PORTR|nr:hypothetical protein [Portunus trituberculatus]